MSGSLNKVILVGNLGADPEVRMTTKGDKVANLSIATSEKWKDSSGGQQIKTEWHRVIIFGGLAGICEQYLKKGAKILIEGKLQTRKWTAPDGNDRYTTEVVVSGFGGNMVMLDNANSGQQNNYQKNNFNQDSSSFTPKKVNKTENNSPVTKDNDFSDLDDDIPF